MSSTASFVFQLGTDAMMTIQSRNRAGLGARFVASLAVSALFGVIITICLAWFYPIWNALRRPPGVVNIVSSGNYTLRAPDGRVFDASVCYRPFSAEWILDPQDWMLPP